MLLEKANGVSRVTRAWEGQTAVCIASGPSLTKEQCEIARDAGFRIGVTNDSYLMAPSADLCYFADPKWFHWHKDREEFKSFAGQKCSITANHNAVPDAAVHVLGNAGAEGVSLDPTKIVTGAHSGYQLLNIVIMSGAKRILLLGYDCKRGPDEKKHWFGDHPDKSEPPYTGIRFRYNAVVPVAARLGIDIINCTPGSWIECFPTRSLESLLADQASAVLPA